MAIYQKTIRKRVAKSERENKEFVEELSKKRKYESHFCLFLQVDVFDSAATEKDLEDTYQRIKDRGEEAVLINLKSGTKKEFRNGKETISPLILIPGINEDLKKAINHLFSNEARQKDVNFNGGQDFALIKLVIDKGLVNGYERIISKSPQYFIELMTSLGYGAQIVGRSTIYKLYRLAETDIFPWKYLDRFENRKLKRYCDPAEQARRNRIVWEFVEYMKHLRGGNKAVNNFVNSSI